MNQQKESVTKIFLSMVDAAVKGEVSQLSDEQLAFLKCSNTNGLIQTLETECLRADVEECLLNEELIHEGDPYYNRMINYVTREYEKDFPINGYNSFLDYAYDFKHRYGKMEVDVE